MGKELPDKISFDKIKAVILDMDGVLVDTEPIHLESFKILLADLQLDYDDSFLNSLVGHSVESNMTMIFQKIGRAVPEIINAEMARRESIYLDLLQTNDLHPLPGIPALVDICKKNKLELALATSSIREQVDTILEKLSGDSDGKVLNLKEILRVIVSGDQVKHKKPAADIYQQVVHKLKLKPEQCAAVEDSPAGVKSAKAAGVYCIALRNRYWNRDQLLEAQADCIADSIMEIVSVITSNK
jgi:beta-phosphoglucomutase-like phosphatase (HAD superfamily)